VSCKATSSLEFESTIPVNPPKVNKNKNPIVHSTGKDREKNPPAPVKVANQLKILIPVGTAIIIVAVVK